MRIALCNEVLRHLPFEVQCAAAAEIGYDALEVAPFTLGDEPHRLTTYERSRIRKSLAAAGLAMSGLHMLMQAPAGLSITSAETGTAKLTQEVGEGLVSLCAELGGRYLVHGSGQQRHLRAGDEGAGRRRGMAYFEAMAKASDDSGVTYCVEALSPDRTNFITSIKEAIDVVDEIGAPALRTMLDCSHAARSEPDGIPNLLRRHVPTGYIVHVHANEANGGGPGNGNLDFNMITKTLMALGYEGTIGVEPFVYEPDPIRCAEDSVRHLRRCMNATVA